MSQAKIDEAVWFESLLAPDPEPERPEAAPEPPRRWFRFRRRVAESAAGR